MSFHHHRYGFSEWRWFATRRHIAVDLGQHQFLLTWGGNR